MVTFLLEVGANMYHLHTLWKLSRLCILITIYYTIRYCKISCILKYSHNIGGAKKWKCLIALLIYWVRIKIIHKSQWLQSFIISNRYWISNIDKTIHCINLGTNTSVVIYVIFYYLFCKHTDKHQFITLLSIHFIFAFN